MNLIFTLLAVVVTASVDGNSLKVIAQHSAGDSKQLQWQIRIENGRVNVLTADAARNAAFELTDEQRRQLIALLDETRVFALKAKYGQGAMEANSCRMTVSWKGNKSTVTLLMYSKKRPQATPSH
jgi:hypothetical protein